MLPPISPRQIPPFYKLGEYHFQELGRDLMEKEPNIATASLYGKRGQGQRGIDIIARRKSGDGIEVGQCKNYEVFSVKGLIEASDDFLKYWDNHWSKQHVRRFVLLVSIELDETQYQDEITKQTQRFLEYGIDYEVWHAVNLRNKLRLHHDIAQAYLPEPWVTMICGKQDQINEMAPYAASPIEVALKVHAGKLTRRLSADIEKRIVQMNNTLQEGRYTEVSDWIAELKGDENIWESLVNELRARITRLESLVIIKSQRDLARATQLADEAHVIAPEADDTRLRAWLHFLEGDDQSALTLLEGCEDIDSLDLKCTILLHMGHTDDAQAILDSNVVQDARTPESTKNRALVYLLKGNIAQAKALIEQALETHPNWIVMRFTYGVILYFSAISPAVLPHALTTWPIPIQWELIKQDDESLGNLRKAEGIFSELASSASNSDSQLYNVWRIACLANDIDRRTSAAQLCEQLLAEQPVISELIIWAIVFGFSVDLQPHIIALEQLASEGVINLPQVETLFTYYQSIGCIDRSIELLLANRPLFEHKGELSRWTTMFCVTQIEAGNKQAVQDALSCEDLADTDWHAVYGMLLEAQAKEDNNWSELGSYLIRRYEENGSPNCLFQYCSLMAKQGQWGVIADHATQLIEEINTARAVELAAGGAFNVRRYELCRQLLDQYRHIFQHQVLPNQLRRMHVICQLQLGDLAAAVMEAELLIRDEATIDNILCLAQVYFERGDLNRLAVVARQLYMREDVPAVSLLETARLIQGEDPGLAVDLWKKAVALGLSDDLVGPALLIGFRLGLDKELAQLSQRMELLAAEGRGGIIRMQVNEWLPFLTHQASKQQEIERLYLNGTMPVHMFGHTRNVLLAELFQIQLSLNEHTPNPGKQPPLLGRHGSRVVHKFPDAKLVWRLNLDITAILLAEYLGILSLVESTFAPVRIPARALEALTRTHDGLMPHQPRRVSSAYAILDMFEHGLLHVDADWPKLSSGDEKIVQGMGIGWTQLLAKARLGNGYVVDFLPLRRADLTASFSLPRKKDRERLIRPRTVVDALRNGPLSEAAYHKALYELGTEGQSPIQTIVPPRHSPVFFSRGVIPIMAEPELLRHVCEYFEVHVGQWDIDEARGIISYEKERDEARKRISDLMQRLNRGIDSGIYEIIPDPPIQDSEEDYLDNPDFGSLQALLLADLSTTNNDVVWIDDRAVNKFPGVSADIPIIGISEVLYKLAVEEAISIEEFYRFLFRLRACNVQLIPLTKSELRFLLEQSSIQDGNVVESEELRVLRSYFAACLSPSSVLYQSVSSVPDAREIAFVDSYEREIIESLNALVIDRATDKAVLYAWRQWIMDNMLIDLSHFQSYR